MPNHHRKTPSFIPTRMAHFVAEYPLGRICHLRGSGIVPFRVVGHREVRGAFEVRVEPSVPSLLGGAWIDQADFPTRITTWGEKPQASAEAETPNSFILW